MLQDDRWALKVLSRLAAFTAVACVVGCATVLAIDADRYVDDGHDAGRSGPWACLDLPGEALSPNAQVEVTLEVMDGLQPSTSAGAIDGGSDLDTVSGTWLPGVSVRSCALRDLNCVAGSAPVITNDSGMATFRLMENFGGFFDIRRPDLVPATLYPGNLLTGEAVESFPVYDIGPGGLRALGMSITSDPLSMDPNGQLGHSLVTTYDCLDHQATDIVLTYSASSTRTVAFYFQGGLPSATAAETDGFGLGGAINVPAGSMTVTATLAPSMRVVGKTTFLVRPGALTFAWIRARTH